MCLSPPPPPHDVTATDSFFLLTIIYVSPPLSLPFVVSGHNKSQLLSSTAGHGFGCSLLLLTFSSEVKRTLNSSSRELTFTRVSEYVQLIPKVPPVAKVRRRRVKNKQIIKLCHNLNFRVSSEHRIFLVMYLPLGWGGGVEEGGDEEGTVRRVGTRCNVIYMQITLSWGYAMYASFATTKTL